MIEEKDFSNAIDLPTELKICSDFIKKYWNVDTLLTDEQFDDIMAITANKVSHIFKDILYKYISSDINELYQERKNKIKDHRIADDAVIGRYANLGEKFTSFDSKVSLVFRCYAGVDDYIRATEASSEIYSRDFVKELRKEITQNYPDFERLRPKGYNQVLVNYQNQVDMDDVDEDLLMDQFSGHRVRSGSVLSSEFPVAIQANDIAYHEIERGKKPSYSLLNGLISHLYGIVIHNNSHELLDELIQMDLNTPVSFDDLIEPSSGWMAKVWKYAPDYLADAFRLTEEIITDQYAKEAEYAALTDEEKAAREEENLKEVMKMLDEMAKPKIS